MDIIYDFLVYFKLMVSDYYFYSLFFFFIFLLIYNSFCIPGNIFFIAASGYFYGLFIGFLISIITIVLGSLFFFTFSSFIFKNFFSKTFYKYSKNIDKHISNSSLEYLIIFRFIPGTPLMIQNLLLSILNIKKTLFIISTLLGLSPFVLLIVYFGNHLNKFDNLTKITFSTLLSTEFLIFLIIMISLLGLRIFLKKPKD